jgi:hypothetical protein
MDLFIKVGNKISAVTESQLPRLTNGVNDFAILDVNGADIGFSNNAHSILWWGASTTTATNDQFLGLKKALECASIGSNRGVVYGNNEVLSLTSTLSVSNLNVELRDLEVSITGGNYFTCASSDIEVVNCRLTGVNFTSCTNVVLDNCKLFGSTDHTISSDIVEVSRCNIVMNASETITLTATNELYYEGNRSASGRFNFTTGSNTNIISNNRFNGLVRVSGTATQNLITINGGSNSTINGNSFYGSDSSSATQVTKVVYFLGTGVAVDSLNSVGNSFYLSHSGDNLAGGSSWRPYDADGYANTGHNAVISKNTIGDKFFQIKQTDMVSVIIGTVTTALLYSEGLFPYTNNPTNMFIQAQNNSYNIANITPTSAGGRYILSVSIDGLTASDNLYFNASCSKPTS